MVQLTLVYSISLFLASLVTASGSLQPPATDPVLGKVTSQGCFGSVSATSSRKQMQFLSVGSCSAQCESENKAVVILNGNYCFCADTYPPRHSLVDDAQCDSPCPGYSMQACGGSGAYSVYNSGLEVNVKYDDSSSEPTVTTSASSTNSASASASAAASASTSASTSASSASESSTSVSTTIVSTSQPTSTPSTSTVAHSNDAAHKLSGICALVWLCLALTV